MNRPLLVLTSLIAFASPCRAASFVWFFSSANPTCDAVPANPVNLCNSDYNAPVATFTDTTATFDITARGYDLGTGTSPLTLVVGTTVWTVPSMSPNNDLWAKFDGGNLGADETGLGVANPNTAGNREIEKTNFIQLDLTSLPADVQSVDLVISSLQSTETATVWGSNTLGQPGLLLATFVGPGAGGAAVVTFHYDLSAGLYLTVSANPNQSGANNVLIQSGFAAEIPTTTTTSSTTTTSTTTTTTTSTTTTTLVPDHFSCYEILPTKFTSIPGVTLVDQFASTVATVTKPHFLCAPADKNNEDPGAETHPDHLTAYIVRNASVKKLNQTIVNQFGTILLDVIKPDLLMVPSAKAVPPATQSPPAPTNPAVDHFQCYKVKRSKGSSKFQKYPRRPDRGSVRQRDHRSPEAHRAVRAGQQEERGSGRRPAPVPPAVLQGARAGQLQHAAGVPG